MPINQQTAEEAYKTVLKNAGAILPGRDAVDSRIIKEVRGGYATYEGKSYKQEHQLADHTKVCGIIDTQADVGGWPELKSTPAPADLDHDGMPDEWEKKNGYGMATKCDYCMDRVKEGQQPACVEACPAKARYFGDLDDPESEISILIRREYGFQLNPEFGTDPSCFYLPPR